MGDREKSQECIQWLTAHADALKSSYPSAYEPWDYEALTMETNRITLPSFTTPSMPPIRSPGCGKPSATSWGPERRSRSTRPTSSAERKCTQTLRPCVRKKTDLVEIITNDVASGAINPLGLHRLSEPEKEDLGHRRPCLTNIWANTPAIPRPSSSTTA